METICDKKGQTWTRCVDGTSIPYKIDKDIEQQIQDKMLSTSYVDDDIQQFLIKLPFYSYPMWPKTQKDVKDVADFCFCICLKCGKQIGGAGCLYLSFNVIITTSSSTPTILWRPRLSCCDYIGFEKSYFHLMTMATTFLKPIFKKAMNKFNVYYNSIDGSKCYVCEDELPCDNKICKYVLTKVSPNKITPDEHMYNLMKYFIKIKLDILTGLCENMCCNYGCRKRMSNVVCKNCRRIVYCSKKCKNQDLIAHLESGCHNFLKIWNW